MDVWFQLHHVGLSVTVVDVWFQLHHVQQLLASNDEYQRKAAFLALAMTAEGCSERVRTKYLSGWLQHVCQGIQHPSTVVRNAALFALGQFAEHLQVRRLQHSERQSHSVYRQLWWQSVSYHPKATVSSHSAIPIKQIYLIYVHTKSVSFGSL